jgi:O-acetylserine/cysteine efflux transporter
MRGSLPWRHFLLALAVAAVWGTNFAIIKLVLGTLPPLLFAALRFALAFFPAFFSSNARRSPGVIWRCMGC